MIAPVTQEDRDRFFELAAGHTSYVSVVVDGAVYLVRTEDQNVGKSLFVKGGRSEIVTLRRATALVQDALGEDTLKDTEFLDVGANIGTTTVSALLHGPFASAICFEPERQNLVDLRLNLLLNGLEDRATAIGVALSDQSGTTQFVANPGRSGAGWVATDDARLERMGPDDEAVAVRTVTLDELVDSGAVKPDRVGMLWMDAQSHEGHILAGGARLLEHGVPIVLEWYPRSLDRLGDRDKLQDMVADHYTHFIDLREAPAPDIPEHQVHEAGTLGDYAEPFTRSSTGRRFTDILVLRLPAGVADRIDVAKALGSAAQSPRRRAKAVTRAATAKLDPKAPRTQTRRRAAPAKRPKAQPQDTERDELREAKRALIEGIGSKSADVPGGERATLRDVKRSAEAQALRARKRALVTEAKDKRAKPPPPD